MRTNLPAGRACPAARLPNWYCYAVFTIGTILTMNLTITGVQRRLTTTALAVGILLGSSTSVLAGDAAAGEKKAYTCLGCHGVLHYVNTYPTYHVPKLGGQHKDYLVDALKAYRSKKRSHGTMQANANLLSDEDIDDIAEYFASQGNQ